MDGTGWDRANELKEELKLKEFQLKCISEILMELVREFDDSKTFFEAGRRMERVLERYSDGILKKDME